MGLKCGFRFSRVDNSSDLRSFWIDRMVVMVVVVVTVAVVMVAMEVVTVAMTRTMTTSMPSDPILRKEPSSSCCLLVPLQQGLKFIQKQWRLSPPH